MGSAGDRPDTRLPVSSLPGAGLRYNPSVFEVSRAIAGPAWRDQRKVRTPFRVPISLARLLGQRAG